MAYLVDGNNVMGQRVGWHKDKRGRAVVCSATSRATRARAA
jgi:hypothetical protein